MNSVNYYVPHVLAALAVGCLVVGDTGTGILQIFSAFLYWGMNSNG